VSPRVPLWLRMLGFVALYLALSAFAINFNGPSHIAMYWPASGLAFAVVVVAGWRWALLVAAALVLKSLWFEPVPPAFLAFSIAGNVGGLLVGGGLARRETTLRPGSVRYAIRMMACGMLMSAISGAVGGYGLWVNGLADQLPTAQLLWALGDFLGIASVAPALMIGAVRWQRGQLRSSQPQLAGERSLWNIALVASYLLMAWGMGASGDFALGLTTLPLAAMVWSAVRFTPMRTSVSAMITVALIAMLAAYGLAGFPRPDGTLETAVLLGYLCLLAILPQALALSVDEHRALTRRLQRRASTDPLSRLPNRGAFEAQARAAMGDPSQTSLALAYLDLDNLKLVNDTASHRAGDALIVAIAEALRLQLHADDSLGHLGGDEFVVLMRNASATAARERALGLLRAVERARCRYGGEELGTTASVGLVPFQPGRVDFAELLSQADAACFAAKELGGDRVRVAGVGSNALSDPVSGMRWTVRIRDALRNDGFLLYAQSIVPLQPDPEPGARFELLLRMRDEHGGPPHTPDTFIAAAERFRLALRIDREVVRMALAQLDAQPEAAARVALCTITCRPVRCSTRPSSTTSPSACIRAASRRRGCASRSPRPARCAIRRARSARSTSCVAWVAVSRWTISAPGSVPTATCVRWTWTSSRSTAASSRTWRARRCRRKWSARSPASPTCSTRRPSPSTPKATRCVRPWRRWGWITRRVTRSTTRSR